MRRLLLVPALVALVLTSSFVPTRAQHRLQPVAAMSGRPALELMLRKLDTVGNVMMTTAHPDDENNALLADYGLAKGFRTSLVTATRGDGGQNEIGPELFDALAVLRTEELLAVHQFDGAEQYFTRAVDFGYSFSVDETLEKWGRQEILGDYVRLIRTIRPDVDRRHSARRRGRRAAPPGVGASHARGVPRGRRPGEVPRADPRRPAAVAAEEVLLHGPASGLRRREPPPQGDGREAHRG